MQLQVPRPIDRWARDHTYIHLLSEQKRGKANPANGVSSVFFVLSPVYETSGEAFVGSGGSSDPVGGTNSSTLLRTSSDAQSGHVRSPPVYLPPPFVPGSA